MNPFAARGRTRYADDRVSDIDKLSRRLAALDAPPAMIAQAREQWPETDVATRAFLMDLLADERGDQALRLAIDEYRDEYEDADADTS